MIRYWSKSELDAVHAFPPKPQQAGGSTTMHQPQTSNHKINKRSEGTIFVFLNKATGQTVKVPQDGLNYYSIYDISFNYVTGTTNSYMTDNTSLENTTKVTQLKWIDIYTSRTYIQKNHNLILLPELKRSMV